MKKLIFGVVIGLFAVATTASAAALTQQQIDAILGLLRSFGADTSVVANVESALTGGTTIPAPNSWCHTFNTNLKIGDKGSEASNLLRALMNEGNTFSDYTTGENYTWKGASFNEEVASAVTQFQEKYRSEILTPSGLTSGTGYVGAATRKKLNQLYGCTQGVPMPTMSDCSLLNNSKFQSIKDEIMGISPSGVVRGRSPLSFENGRFSRILGDVAESGTYSCPNNILELRVNDFKYKSRYDRDRKVIIIDSIEYERVVPSSRCDGSRC